MNTQYTYTEHYNLILLKCCFIHKQRVAELTRRHTHFQQLIVTLSQLCCTATHSDDQKNQNFKKCTFLLVGGAGAGLLRLIRWSHSLNVLKKMLYLLT